MGGKGQRRREKNYKRAHGGDTRLPPPPVPSQVDAIPSKLRQIMSFASHPPNEFLESAKAPKLADEKRKREVGDLEKKRPREDAITSETIVFEDKDGSGHVMTPQDTDNGDDVVHDSRDEKRKKKRKRKQVDDLRFENIMGKTKSGEKRRERKKRYLEAKKKRHKKSEREENLNFPGREQIKFGDVVQAPPKLVVLPKASKNVQDASQERIRLKAIEAYRKRKGWAARPGLKLPGATTLSL